MSLREVADAALAACDGERLCAGFDLGASPPVHVAGAGKAAGQMARGVARGCSVLGGLVVTKEGAFDGFAPAGVKIVFAGHPTPDTRSSAAARSVTAWLTERQPDERVVFVLSGGASSLLTQPLPGLTAADVATTTRALVASGLSIDAINTVRKQLLCATAGRLARVCRAELHVLVLSDVVSGELGAVGSGPFVPDPHTHEDARRLLAQVDAVPDAVVQWLRDPPAEALAPRVGDRVFDRVRHHVLATPATLLEEAVAAARGTGAYDDVLRLPLTTDDVDVVAERLVRTAADLPTQGLVVAGGEPTIRLPRHPGLGGRNQHLALCVARAIAGRGWRFLAIGSDGSDGPTDAAGALVDGDTWARCEHLGDPEAALATANVHPLLEAAGALIHTGPTGTNLCDLHLLSV